MNGREDKGNLKTGHKNKIEQDKEKYKVINRKIKAKGGGTN